jgi:hypothetical protein
MTGPESGTGLLHSSVSALPTRPHPDRRWFAKPSRCGRARARPQARYGILQKLLSIRGNRAVFSNPLRRHLRVRICIFSAVNLLCCRFRASITRSRTAAESSATTGTSGSVPYISQVAPGSSATCSGTRAWDRQSTHTGTDSLRQQA